MVWYNVHESEEQCGKKQVQIFVMLACKKICTCFFP